MDGPDYSVLDQLAARTPARNKIEQAAANARKRGVNIDDYDVNDFYNAMAAESSRSHFTPNGAVKYGVPTKNGERAVGFSQILPSTARGVDRNLDPTKELDNIELGLRYFKGLGSDPIERRIRYVGGGKGAVNYYRKNGTPPDWKLYSYLPENKETYRSYVEKGLGGTIRRDGFDALDRLSNGKQDYSALDQLANQDFSGLDNLKPTAPLASNGNLRPEDVPPPPHQPY